jgi:hypothetical protein
MRNLRFQLPITSDGFPASPNYAFHRQSVFEQSVFEQSVFGSSSARTLPL